jgi:hypothetical protein
MIVVVTVVLVSMIGTAVAAIAPIAVAIADNARRHGEEREQRQCHHCCGFHIGSVAFPSANETASAPVPPQPPAARGSRASIGVDGLSVSAL